jgi:hypothetical protein
MAKQVMEEREEPRFTKFATGDVLDGVLVSIDRITIEDKPAIRYTVREHSGEFVSFLGTHQLNQKLRTTDRGHLISIRCEGEDTMVRKGDNCMKVFKVLVSKELAEDGDLYISEADIPF